MGTKKPIPTKPDPAIAFISAERNPSGKTVFNLRQDSINYIEKLANDTFMSMKEVLDVMAKILDKKSRNAAETLEVVEIGGDRKRKSFTISERAREIFNNLAKKYGVSRDTILETAVEFLKSPYDGIKLNAEEKMMNARILQQMVKDMEAILYNPVNQAALQKLTHCEDPDFGTSDKDYSCGYYFSLVSHLDYLPNALKDYIVRKEEEQKQEDEQ